MDPDNPACSKVAPFGIWHLVNLQKWWEEQHLLIRPQSLCDKKSCSLQCESHRAQPAADPAPREELLCLPHTLGPEVRLSGGSQHWDVAPKSSVGCSVPAGVS